MNETESSGADPAEKALTENEDTEPTSLEGQPMRPLHLRHTIFGWGLILFSTTVGISLEALHGFKMGWYLDVGNEMRRLMLTLGHGHGTLLGVINLVFATSTKSLSDWSKKGRDFASRCLMVASILVPGGFLLGGIHIYDGDPGLGIMLVPVGAFAFIVMLFSTLMAAIRQSWRPPN